MDLAEEKEQTLRTGHLRITTDHKEYGSKYSPVKTAQPAAAASDMLWPARPGKKDPPTTAMEVIPYKYLNSPKLHVEITLEDLSKTNQNILPKLTN